MQSERRLVGIRGNFLDARNDAAFFVFLLAVCLAYSVCTSFTYLTTFKLGIFDFAWRPIGRDFVNYWSAAVAVSDGMILQIFDASVFHPYQEQLLGQDFAEHSWSYPPHMLLVIWPFGQLPYLWALAAWSFLGLGLYLWTAAGGRAEMNILLVALLLAPATYENFSGGQNGFVTAVLLIGGFRLLGTRPIIAGILFGVLTVKPQLGVLLPFALLAARQWTTIAAASATALVLLGGSVLLFGWESWQAYIDLVIPQQATLMTKGAGIYLAMMPSPYMALRLLEVEPWLRMAIHGIFVMIAVVGVVWAFARSKDADLNFGVLAVGTFLASPYGFNYDMTTVSLAVAVVALRGLSQGFLPGERIVLAMVWLLPTTIHWLNVNHLPLGPLLLLACFSYFLLRIRRSRPGEHRTA